MLTAITAAISGAVIVSVWVQIISCIRKPSNPTEER
jgi:hypothetical protein